MKSNRLKDEIFGGISVCDNIVCKTCLFVVGSPKNSACKIYNTSMHSKPQDVYFYGAPCKYRKTQKDLEELAANQK